jgi:hypothetical protein
MHGCWRGCWRACVSGGRVVCVGWMDRRHVHAHQPPPTLPTPPTPPPQAKKEERFEFTFRYRDQGWQAFLSSEDMCKDPLFVRDGRLYIDVSVGGEVGGMDLCVCVCVCVSPRQGLRRAAHHRLRDTTRQVMIEEQPGVMYTKNYDSRKEIGLVGLRNQVTTTTTITTTTVHCTRTPRRLALLFIRNLTPEPSGWILTFFLSQHHTGRHVLHELAAAVPLVRAGAAPRRLRRAH